MGLFPCCVGGLADSQERFMDNISFITDLKLRGSYRGGG